MPDRDGFCYITSLKLIRVLLSQVKKQIDAIIDHHEQKKGAKLFVIDNIREGSGQVTSVFKQGADGVPIKSSDNLD